MARFLQLDERLRFYSKAVKTLLYGSVEFEERLNYIQSHKLPASLIAISSQLHTVLAQTEQLGHFDSQVEESKVLMSAFDIDGFFDSWDVLLILAYTQHVYSNAGFLGDFNEFEPSEIIDTIAHKLYEVQNELEESFGYLGHNIRRNDNKRQTDEDRYHAIKETFESFLSDYIYDCHNFKEGEQIRKKILQELKSLYCSLSSIDGEEFANMYENLGFIMYHGNNHGLYQVAQDQLKSEIYDKFLKLDFHQKINLLDELELDRAVEDIEVYNLEGIEDFKSLVLRSDVFGDVLASIRTEFLARVPEYLIE